MPRWPPALAVLVLVTVAASSPGQEPAVRGGAWLDDSPVAPWNQQGAAVPKPPARDGEPLSAGRCSEQARAPDGPADVAVSSAGWTLIGPLQVFGDTSIVLGAVAADGMCRPLGLQAFVFVRGRFAGTLSPQPMDARTDGVLQSALLVSRDRLTATFSRYSPGDALCCPSATLRVTFVIKRSPGGSLLTVEHVEKEGPPAGERGE